MSLAQPEAPPSIGLVGGKYQLVKLIGRGGMGSVWEARHVSLGTPSAIKFIEAEYANSVEARSRFDKEAKAAATIQSKHAIQIYDHGVTDDGKPYIVMELLTGEPLDKRIERLGTLTLHDTAKILQQVSRGLSRAHERGIVHRDLKPENIFIVRNTDDDEEIAKVLDFGIAKIQNSPHSPGVTSSTKTGAVLGTPFFMSPEQARGLRNVDHRTDVWSLGVIAFKCVTGRLPFDGESVGDLLVKICTAPIPLPSHSVPGLPQAFDSWFLRALEREPDRRFSSVSELSEHLAFAAGLGPRGSSSPHSPQAPISPTVAASVPSGGQGITPRPMMGSDQHPNPHGYTPQPGLMTAAPFTSSQPVEPAGGRAKYFIAAALTGLLIAMAGTGIAVTMKKRQTATANSVGLAQSDPAPAVEKSAAPPPAPAVSTEVSVNTLANANANAPVTPATLTGPATPVVATKSFVKPVTAPVTPAGPGPRPPATKPSAIVATPPPLPPPGTTPVVAPAPTPKKASRTDPGY